MVFEGRIQGRRTPGYRRLNNLEEAMPGARSKYWLLMTIYKIPNCCRRRCKGFMIIQ